MKIISKKIYFLCILCSLGVLITACNKKLDNDVDNKQKFKSDSERIINLIKEDNTFPLENNIKYIIYGNYLASDTDNFYDISSYNIRDAHVYLDKSGEIYASLENNEFCAIKDFNENEFKVYNIDEEEKCHKFHILGSDINLLVIPFYLKNNNVYIEGTTSNEYISLSAFPNIVDKWSVKYKWYRNNEEIVDSNVQNYTITSEIEDADYYVEITIPTGEVYKSESINVKIDRR